MAEIKPGAPRKEPGRSPATSTSSSRSDGLETKREKEIGQHIGYRYDVNLRARLRPPHAVPARSTWR